jgi:hypothetical protein
MLGDLKRACLAKQRLETRLALVLSIRQVDASLSWLATPLGTRRFRPFCREAKWLEKKIRHVYPCPNY